MIKGVWRNNTVSINGKRLLLEDSLKLRNHAPTGFSWGYMGSGPSQLALSILIELTDRDTALTHYQDFKHEVIVPLPQADFQLEEAEVFNWLRKKQPV